MSDGVPQVTLKVPPRPPKNTPIFYISNCERLYFIAQFEDLEILARLSYNLSNQVLIRVGQLS